MRYNSAAIKKFPFFIIPCTVIAPDNVYYLYQFFASFFIAFFIVIALPTIVGFSRSWRL